MGEVQDCTCMTYLVLVEAFHLEVQVGYHGWRTKGSQRGRYRTVHVWHWWRHSTWRYWWGIMGGGPGVPSGGGTGLYMYGIGGGIPPGGTGGVSWVEDQGFPAGEVQDCTCMALVEAFHLEVLVGYHGWRTRGSQWGWYIQDCTCMTYLALVEAFLLEVQVGYHGWRTRGSQWGRYRTVHV